MTYPTVPQDHADERTHRRLIAAAVNLLLAGRMNVTGEVTLTPGATETTVTDRRISARSVMVLQPLTQNAASALASVYIPSHGNGSLKLHHAAGPAVDQTFRFALIG